MLSLVTLYRTDYMRDGPSVPLTAASGLTQMETVQDVLPSVERYGIDGKGAVRLPLSYDRCIGANYLGLQYDDYAPGWHVYAWVDSVRPVSTTGGAAVTEVRFTVDPWRSFFFSVDVVRCRFSRVPKDLLEGVPTQTYDVGWWRDNTTWPLIDRSTVYWLVANVVEVDSGGYAAVVPTYVPFKMDGDATPFHIWGNGDVLQLHEILPYLQAGLGTTSDKVVFVGWTDFPVFDWLTVTGQADTYTPDVPTTGVMQVATAFHGASTIRLQTLTHAPALRTVSVGPGGGVAPQPGYRYVLKGYSDDVVDVVPGESFSSLRVGFVNDWMSAYIRIVLAAHDIEWEVPIETLAVGKNGMSEYLYAGLREYEVDTMELNRQTALLRGMTGAASSGATTGAFGMMGSNAAMAGPMAAVAAAGSVVGTAADYWITGDANVKSQRLKDAYMAKTGTVSRMGQGVYDLTNRPTVRLVRQTPDSESQMRWSRSLAYYGADTDLVAFPALSSGFWNAGGPYRATDMKIRVRAGATVPAYGIDGIRRLFAGGVMIE